MKHTHKLRAFVFDIDGTLAMMDKDTSTYAALPGAVDAVRTLQSRGFPVVAYTNGTFFPPEYYVPKLADSGFKFTENEILTPATVAARKLTALNHKRVMLIGAEGTRLPLQQIGIEVIDAQIGAPKVDAVLLAWTKDFNAANLEAAAQAIWAGAPLYATSLAPYFAGAKGKMLGVSGALAAALNNATGAKATVFGKPSVDGLDIIAAQLGIAAHEMAVIGDDPKLEIMMARRGGAFAVGVTSGVANHAAFEAMPQSERAQVILPDLTGFLAQSWLN